MKKKHFLFLVLFLLPSFVEAQTENLIVVTIDGFRWQEIFNGMDKEIALNKKFERGDSAKIFSKFWDENPEKRRSLLMPFLWNTISKQGQIYGNRNLGNKVSVSNPYWFSYPGYSEIFCGFVDTQINTNDYKPNPNQTVFDFFSKQNKINTQIAVFGAWEAFDRIFNEKRAKFPVFCGNESYNFAPTDIDIQLLNAMKKNSFKPFGEEEYLDQYTFYGGLSYMKKKHPKIIYISLGETDEFAHQGAYWWYLRSAHQADQWLADLWAFVQSDDQYKNKTVLFFTVDHGRGNGEEWTSHNSSIRNSNEMWFAVLGNGIKPKGEIKSEGIIYQKQFAATWASLLGFDYFNPEKKVGQIIESVVK